MPHLILLLVACDPESAPTRTPPPSPTPLDVAISPAAPVQGRDALRCDAPVDASVRWEVDGAPGPTGPTVAAERTRDGRAWACVATLGDRVGRAEVDVAPLGGNVLLILVDDIGVDRIGVYAAHPNPAQTPVIDGLAASGMRFERAWATPVCSSTRATLLTGRQPGRYGLGHIVDNQLPAVILPAEEVYLPEMLSAAPAPMTSALVGKWHLTGRYLEELDHPSRGAGFAMHTGPVDNIQVSIGGMTPPRSYFRWEENDNGTLVERTGYATRHQVEQAAAQLATLPEPWLLYVAFTGAHIPLHVPPRAMFYSPPADDSDAEKLRVMVESIDIAIGEVLDAVPADQRDRTTVIVTADNGTRADLAAPPLAAGGKGTVYEGGIRVPFIVNGPAVARPGEVSTARVHTVDVFDTLAALAGVDLPALDAQTGAASHPRDSRSFLPALADPSWSAREINVAEWFVPNGPGPYAHVQRAATDGRFKLIASDRPDASERRLFDLEADPDELDDLLELDPLPPDAEAAWIRLSAAIEPLPSPYDLPW